MTAWEKLYLPAIAKGMAITFKHMFHKRPTVNYPEKTRPFSPVFRGLHVLNRDEQGQKPLLVRRARGAAIVVNGRCRRKRPLAHALRGSGARDTSEYSTPIAAVRWLATHWRWIIGAFRS